MAQVSRTTTLLIALLSLCAATGLANTRASGSIEVAQGSKHQHQYRESDVVYGADVPVYGPLVPRVGRNQSQLLRREPGEPGTDGYGPLLNVPGCFFCPEPDVTAKTGRDLLADLTTQKMQSYMRIRSTKDLVNKCVFYSAAVTKPPEYLSDGASIWACAHRKFSIWHLWPNKFMTSNQRFKDFYGINEPDNWLHSIKGMPLIPSDRRVPTMIQYFENMSEAMARSCSGEVVIMSQTPGLMARYLFTDNIWKNKERPALMNLHEQGKIMRFLVVDFNNQDDIWEFDIDGNFRGNKVSPQDLLSRRHLEEETDHFKLLYRDACESTGLAQMPSEGDPFSDDYSKFLI